MLVRGGNSLTLKRLEALAGGVAEILGSGVRLHIGASVAEQPEDRLSLTVLGVVPVNEPEISPAPVFRREPELQTVLVPEEEPFIGDGKPSFSLWLPPWFPNRNGVRSRNLPFPFPPSEGMTMNWKRNWCL